MERKKRIIVPALVLITFLGVGAYGISRASAQGMGIGQASIIEKIAAKFGLNKDEVEKVFEENRKEKRALMNTSFEEKLNNAVSTGELTEQQKQLILAKREEMQSEREKNRAEHMKLSTEERRNKMSERQAELEKWAKDNGIDIKYLMGMGMGKMGQNGGFGRGFFRGQ